MSTVLGVLLIGLLITWAIFSIIGIVKDLKFRKRKKQQNSNSAVITDENKQKDGVSK